MTDTDSKMMRGQQAKDVHHAIDPDETHPAPTRHDSDAVSGRDREAAKAGETTSANDAMDAVFHDNGGSEGGGERLETALFEDAATDGKIGLARKGRSLLGD